MTHFKAFAFKKIGCFTLEQAGEKQLLQQDEKSFLKIVFIKAGGHVIIDFQEFFLQQDAFFFISPGQHYWLDDCCNGTLLYYNKDFYCVEIHDKEVACDGILFHNVYKVPVVFLQPDQSEILQYILLQIKEEMEEEEVATEEMLRTLLKQIIIRCTRIWKKNHDLNTEAAKPEIEFSRVFSQLVDRHYLQYHTVAEYAALLHITPKALNKRITRYSDTTPNDIIKNRIILEAKRLLVHTHLSIKEISYQLGYEDNSYFTRFFTRQTATSPVNFRLQYLQQ